MLRILLFLVGLCSSMPLPAETQKYALSAKAGRYTISQTDQELAYTHGEPSESCFLFFFCFDSYQQSTADVAIDKHSNIGIGFEFEWLASFGIRFSLESLNFENGYSSSNAPGERGVIHTNLFSLNVKHYFNSEGKFRPFIGIGYGNASVEFTGPLHGELTGEFSSARAGMLYSLTRFDLFMEYLYIDGKNVGGGASGSDNRVVSGYNIDGYVVMLGLRKAF